MDFNKLENEAVLLQIFDEAVNNSKNLASQLNLPTDSRITDLDGIRAITNKVKRDLLDELDPILKKIQNTLEHCDENEYYMSELKRTDQEADKCAVESDGYGKNFFQGLRAGMVGWQVHRTHLVQDAIQTIIDFRK